MKRKTFLKSLATAAAVTAVNPVNAAQKIKTPVQSIKPQRLKKGDTLGLVAPGSFIREDELKESVENLESLGFKTVYTERILNKKGYLAGSDKERAEDLLEMFDRKDVDGIVCARGGYGCARILPILDYDLIKENPKVLIGYSDITALLYGIYAETGLVCFHGPVGISTFNDFTNQYFDSVLMNPKNNLTFYSAQDDDEDSSLGLKTIRSGKAKGKLAGGNLSIVVSLIGTKYDVDTDGKIVFIEEVGEEPYRIDRMLTQMIESGKFDKAAGIALGVFSHCDARGSDSGILNSFTLEEVLFDRLYNLGIPVVYGLSFGHIRNKFTIPFGAEAELDSTEQIITLPEPAVL